MVHYCWCNDSPRHRQHTCGELIRRLRKCSLAGAILHSLKALLKRCKANRRSIQVGVIDFEEESETKKSKNQLLRLIDSQLLSHWAVHAKLTHDGAFYSGHSSRIFSPVYPAEQWPCPSSVGGGCLHLQHLQTLKCISDTSDSDSVWIQVESLPSHNSPSLLDHRRWRSPPSDKSFSHQGLAPWLTPPLWLGVCGGDASPVRLARALRNKSCHINTPWGQRERREMWHRKNKTLLLVRDWMPPL